MAETFGETVKQPNEGGFASNFIVGSKFQSGSAGTLAKMTMYCKWRESKGDCKVKLAIYDTDLKPLANGITDEVTITSEIDGDVDFVFSTPPTVEATTDYWLCFNCDPGFYQYWGAGGANQELYKATTYDVWPDPIPEVITYLNRKYTIFATYVENQPPTAPTSLEVDGKSTPTGANCVTSTPQFTAIFNDPDSGDESNAIQIQVGSASGLSDMWDSGWLVDSTVEGNRCDAETYDGAALSAGTSYWWRCRFRDDDNAEGAWSDWQQFYVCAAAVEAAAGGLLSQIW